MSYLLDKSAWEQIQYSTDTARRVGDLIRSGHLGLCSMTAMDVLYSARNAADYSRTYSRLTNMPWFELSQPRRALELQHALAQKGWHRTPIPDVVIAATAAEHELTVLHYDSDFERLAEVAGASHEWVTPRGKGHGRGPAPANLN